MIGEVIDSSKINESAANQMLAVFSELTKKDKTVIAIAG
jgi:hypothetical protein